MWPPHCFPLAKTRTPPPRTWWGEGQGLPGGVVTDCVYCLASCFLYAMITSLTPMQEWAGKQCIPVADSDEIENLTSTRGASSWVLLRHHGAVHLINPAFYCQYLCAAPTLVPRPRREGGEQEPPLKCQAEVLCAGINRRRHSQLLYKATTG